MSNARNQPNTEKAQKRSHDEAFSEDSEKNKNEEFNPPTKKVAYERSRRETISNNFNELKKTLADFNKIPNFKIRPIDTQEEMLNTSNALLKEYLTLFPAPLLTTPKPPKVLKRIQPPQQKSTQGLAPILPSVVTLQGAPNISMLFSPKTPHPTLVNPIKNTPFTFHYYDYNNRSDSLSDSEDAPQQQPLNHLEIDQDWDTTLNQWRYGF